MVANQWDKWQPVIQSTNELYPDKLQKKNVNNAFTLNPNSTFHICRAVRVCRECRPRRLYVLKNICEHTHVCRHPMQSKQIHMCGLSMGIGSRNFRWVSWYRGLLFVQRQRIWACLLPSVCMCTDTVVHICFWLPVCCSLYSPVCIYTQWENEHHSHLFCSTALSAPYLLCRQLRCPHPLCE